MKLYFAEGACSRAPHIILQELGIPFETKKMSFENGDLNNPEFLKLNPIGAVPVLELSPGEALTEGTAILQYLADLKPELKLAPARDSKERYTMQSVLNFISTELHKGFSPLFTLEYQSEDKAIQDKLEIYWSEQLSERIQIFSDRLANKEYLFASGFTIADAYAFTVLSWSKYIDFDLSRWPTIVKYLERVKGRPATQRAISAERLN